MDISVDAARIENKEEFSKSLSDTEDRDGDGTVDRVDPCPASTANDADEDGVCEALLTDLNGDGCVDLQDKDQFFRAFNGEVDLPEADFNSDGVFDLVDLSIFSFEFGSCADNCPRTNNPDQLDTDGDGIGDLCDFSYGGDCGQIFTFADGVEYTQVLHVKISGDDGNSGTETNPLRTVQGAIDRAKSSSHGLPGTEILIHPGDYSGSIVYLTQSRKIVGTSSKPVRIAGTDPLDRPIFGGNSEGFKISGAQYFSLENVEIRNVGDGGINIDDYNDAYVKEYGITHHIVFRNIYIHDIGSPGGNDDGIKMAGVEDFYILNSHISDSSLTGIDMVGVHRGIIARNLIERCGKMCITPKGGAEEILIYANKLVDCGWRGGVELGGYSDGWNMRPPYVDYEVRNSWVISNLTIGGHTGIAVIGARDSLLANNTIYRPERTFAHIQHEFNPSEGYAGTAPPQRDIFVNNLYVGETSHMDPGSAANSYYGSIHTGEFPLDSFLFENNLFYSLDESDFQPLWNFSGGRVIPHLNNILNEDPLLTNPSGGVFSLESGSPAAGAGVNHDKISVGDFVGRCFLEARPSIGAFEVPE